MYYLVLYFYIVYFYYPKTLIYSTFAYLNLDIHTTAFAMVIKIQQIKALSS